MAEVNPYLIRDSETLRLLGNGLEIIRREKHEWKSSLAGLTAEQLIRRTGKVWGSKFYPDWTLPVLVSWIENVIAAEGWTLQPGIPSATDRELDRTVGLVAGSPTHMIRVVSDGRYVHAYPIAE